MLLSRSPEPECAVRFYELLGLTFTKHRHGSGPEHFACEMEGMVFEIYPGAEVEEPIRLGFHVAELDRVIEKLQASCAVVIAAPKQSLWGYRAVVQGPDGVKVELVEAKGPEPT